MCWEAGCRRGSLRWSVVVLVTQMNWWWGREHVDEEQLLYTCRRRLSGAESSGLAGSQARERASGGVLRTRLATGARRHGNAGTCTAARLEGEDLVVVWRRVKVGMRCVIEVGR